MGGIFKNDGNRRYHIDFFLAHAFVFIETFGVESYLVDSLLLRMLPFQNIMSGRYIFTCVPVAIAIETAMWTLRCASMLAASARKAPKTFAVSHAKEGRCRSICVL